MIVQAVVALAASAANAGLKNVLFLIADDLRPQLNKAYGKTFMHTPNLDKFTESALVFDWAYTNMAICSASRNSFLTGRVPDKTRTWNFIDDFREGGANWTTLPQFFKAHGYTTLGHGKTFHPGHPANNDLPYSWDAYPCGTTNTNCNTPKQHKGGNFCPDANGAENRFSDVNVTKVAVQTIKDTAAAALASGKPWFIAMGWHYPHQPWHVPQWAMDMYKDVGTLNLPAPKNPFSPKNVPDIAFTAEMDGQASMSINEDNPAFDDSKPAGTPAGSAAYIQPRPGNNTFPEWFAQQLRVGYYSAVTHMDRHFGQVMDALAGSGAADDTVVIMTGDHGWQLGEHSEWGKHTNFELGTHVPLLIRDAPSASTAGAGKHASRTRAELVDLYRTLVSLAGLPASDIEDDVDGIDLSPVVRRDATLLARNYSFSQYSRCPGDRDWKNPVPNAPGWFMNNCEQVPSHNISFMGYTMRSAEYRYTMWFRWDKASCVALWDDPLDGEELYSHEGHTDPGDFDDYENENLAAEPAYAGVVARHRKLLLDNFKDCENCRLEGCPTQHDPPAPAPAPPPTALSLIRSAVANDSELCGDKRACRDGHGASYKYKDVDVEGFSVAPGQLNGRKDVHTIELQLYWSSEDHDNLVTTSAASYKPPAGFKLCNDSLNPVATIVATAGVEGTVPLYLYYNEAKKDHLTCALKSTCAASGYVLAQQEPLGYVYAQWAELYELVIISY